MAHVLGDAAVIGRPDPLREALGSNAAAAAGLNAGAKRYVVGAEIGRGGMGIVHEVVDRWLDRRVAMKALGIGQRHARPLVRRFLWEAQIASQLQHPGVVPVYRLGVEAGGVPYFLMQRIEGRSLAAWLRGRPLPRRRLVSWFERVCEAVAHAHRCGVIHRDLKPANVMVGPFGQVYVVDWGIAKILARQEDEDPRDHEILPAARTGSGSESISGSVMGTPAYMAPEQARGEIEQMDERADVFGLGAILCEILTGRPPFHGSSEEALKAARLGRVGLCWDDVDPAYRGLLTQCLEVDCDRRARDAGVVLRALRETLEEIEDRRRRAEIRALKARAAAATFAAEADAVAAEVRAACTRTASAAAAAAAAARAADRAGVIERASRRLRRWTVFASGAVVLAIVTGTVAWVTAHGRETRRRARVEAQTDEALDRALRAEVGGRLDEALAAARVAAALHTRGQGVLAALERRQSVKQAAARRRRNGARLLHGAPTWTRLEEVGATDRRTAALAAEFGLDPSAPDLERARSLLHAQDAASFLDTWARTRRTNRLYLPETQRDANAPLALARRLDTDPARDAIRAALIAQDIDALVRASRALEGDALPVPTAALLIRALRDVGATDAALALARTMFAAHPYATAITRQAEFLFTEAGLFDEAARFGWARALRDRDRPFAWVHLSVIEERRGRLDAAQQAIRRALALDPKHAVALIRSATLHELRGEFRAALDALSAARRVAPDLPVFRIQTAFMLLKLDRVSDALKEARQAVEKAPDHAAAHEVLSWALERTRRPADALAHARKAVSLDPRLRDAGRRLAHLLLTAGDLEAARAEIERVRALEPDDATTLVILAHVLRSADDPRALAVERDAIRLRPALEPEIVENRVLVLAGRQAWAEVLPWIERYVELVPKRARGWRNLGVVRVALGDAEGALAAYLRAVALEPDDARAHASIGGLLVESGERGDARTALREAVRLEPGLADAHYNLGLLAHSEDADVAIGHYRAALRADPAHVDSRTMIGNLLQGRGDVVAAIREYEAGLAYVPGHTPSLWNLAFARMRCGELGKAIDVFARLEVLAPELDGLAANLSAARSLTLLLEAEAPPAAGLLHWAEIFQRAGLSVAAARAYERAFAREPTRFDELRAGHRYNAACTALLAAHERYTDAAEDARLRALALGWLQAELDLCARYIGGADAAGKREAAGRLAHWFRDADLADVRPPKLADAADAAPWRALWARAKALLP